LSPGVATGRQVGLPAPWPDYAGAVALSPGRSALPRLRRHRPAGPAGPRVRPLSSAEIASYDHLAPDLAARVRVVRLPVIPGRYVGITLGRFVCLDRDLPANGTSHLLAHELTHARQWAELGVVGFLTRYLGGFGRGVTRHRRWHPAYRDIALEQEARAQADAWAQRRSDAGADGRRGPHQHAR